MIKITSLLLVLSFNLHASEAWTEFQKRIEKGTTKFSQHYGAEKIPFNFSSSDRVEGSCKGKTVIDAKTAKEGTLELSVQCDGKGWEKEQKPFTTKKKIAIGNPDTYLLNNPKDPKNEKFYEFEKSGQVRFTKDEAVSFVLKLKSGTIWEISEIEYSSEDPG